MVSEEGVGVFWGKRLLNSAGIAAAAATILVEVKRAGGEGWW